MVSLFPFVVVVFSFRNALLRVVLVWCDRVPGQRCLQSMRAILLNSITLTNCTQLGSVTLRARGKVKRSDRTIRHIADTWCVVGCNVV